MLLPFAGRLQLAATPSRAPKVLSGAKRLLRHGAKPHAAVDVWLHCGLFFREAADDDAEPLPGHPLPTEGGAQRGWHFFPLPRDKPDGTRSFDVRVEHGGSGLPGTHAQAEWVISVVSVDKGSSSAVLTLWPRRRRWRTSGRARSCCARHLCHWYGSGCL